MPKWSRNLLTFIFVAFFCQSISYAQSNKTDSLKKILPRLTGKYIGKCRPAAGCFRRYKDNRRTCRQFRSIQGDERSDRKAQN